MQGLAVGAWGERSETWATLVEYIATKLAKKDRTQSGILASEARLRAYHRRSLIGHWGTLAASGIARIKIDMAHMLNPTQQHHRQGTKFRRRQEFLQTGRELPESNANN